MSGSTLIRLVTTMTDETISLDKDLCRRLESAYREAVKNGQDEFRFEGHLFLTTYAKYLLDYAEYKVIGFVRNRKGE